MRRAPESVHVAVDERLKLRERHSVGPAEVN
jgi:hypothetical protein